MTKFKRPNENILVFYSDSDKIIIKASDPNLVRSVKRWAKLFPEQCVIFKMPNQNAGYIHAEAPREWLKLRMPRTIYEYSEKQKAHLMVGCPSEVRRMNRKNDSRDSAETTIS